MGKRTKDDEFPEYRRIALDLAQRVANGDLQEGERLSGRSLLASEYHVSPETVRRALRLLADMKVLTVRPKSGVVILSADNALRYANSSSGESERRQLEERLRGLFSQLTDTGREMIEVYSKIVESHETPLPADNKLPSYEIRIPDTSKLIGKNLGVLRFWQKTGATVAAIRRQQNMILSPGPYAELYGGDVVVLICPPDALKKVKAYVSG